MLRTAGALGLGALMAALPYQPVSTQESSPTATVRLHHVHVNAVNPEASVAYYRKLHPDVTEAVTFNGAPGIKTGNMYLLFNKVNAAPKTESTAPQTAVSHYGWSTTDPRKFHEGLAAKGLKTAQMWDAADGELVDMSSDVLPGGPTQEQIIELRAKGTQPTRQGGYGYVRDPDGAVVEYSGGGANPVERFNHIHMFHEHPWCAAHWYVTNLGAKFPEGRTDIPSASDCQQRYGPPTYPAFTKSGSSKQPSANAFFGDISISVWPWPGGGLASTRGYVVDHWAVSVADLDAMVARLRGAGVRFLEDIHPWGTTRAAMIEGPDRVAIELVEEK